MNKTQILLKRYSPLVLTSVSIIGVVATTALGIKATPKAVNLIKKAEKEKGSKLDVKETVKVAWKPYIPTAISCVGTISCILGMYFLNGRSQASLASAYMTLENMHKQYVEKTKELYGEDADDRIKEAIVRDVPYEYSPLGNNTQLFFDYQSARYFESTFDKVLAAENALNSEFAASGCVTVNDYYRRLGLKVTMEGEDTGWYAPGDYYEIEFEHQRVIIDDGLECFIIVMTTDPGIIHF